MSRAEQPDYDVESWLAIIDRSEYINRSMRLRAGGSVAVRNFPTVCSADAVAMFADLEATDPSDPDFPDMVEVAKAIFDRHIGKQVVAVE